MMYVCMYGMYVTVLVFHQEEKVDLNDPYANEPKRHPALKVRMYLCIYVCI